MTGTTSRIMRRIFALERARDAAKNLEFKLLWEQKLQELIKLAEHGRSSYDTIH
jgi:hypothetical protein